MTERNEGGERIAAPDSTLGLQRDGESRFKKVTRKRVTVSVHPETARMLVQICLDTASARGQVLDRVVMALYKARESGVQHCVHGPRCIHNLPYKTTVL